MSKKIVFTSLGCVLTFFTVSFSQNDCLETGTLQFGKKEYKKVILTLKKCDTDPKAQELLGMSYFELNYMEEAKIYLQNAIQSNPSKVELQIKYASAFARNRQFKKSVEEFQKLLTKYPENRDVRCGYALALAWNRNYTDAILEYQKLLKKDSKDFESWIQIGLITSWNKKFKEAVEIYKQILAAQPPEKYEIDIRLNLAEVLSWMKKLDESITEYDKVISMLPKDPRGYLGKGQVLEWQGKYKVAISVYEQAIQASPGNKDAKARLQQLMWVK